MRTQTNIDCVRSIIVYSTIIFIIVHALMCLQLEIWKHCRVFNSPKSQRTIHYR